MTRSTVSARRGKEEGVDDADGCRLHEDVHLPLTRQPSVPLTFRRKTAGDGRSSCSPPGGLTIKEKHHNGGEEEEKRCFGGGRH